MGFLWFKYVISFHRPVCLNVWFLTGVPVLGWMMGLQEEEFCLAGVMVAVLRLYSLLHLLSIACFLTVWPAVTMPPLV